MKIVHKMKYLLFSLILIMGISVAYSEAPNCYTTGEYLLCTDKLDYTPESTVPITGQGFPADTQLLIEVTRPDGSIISFGERVFVTPNFKENEPYLLVKASVVFGSLEII